MFKRIFSVLILLLFVFNICGNNVIAADTEDIHYIDDADDLYLLAEFPNGYFKLRKNVIIDQKFDCFFKTADKMFSGTIDGCGYSISYINIETDGEVAALIGYFSGTIKSLEFTRCSINASSENAVVGGIVAYNMGTIIDCSFSGEVVRAGKKLSDCGIAAVNRGTILRCVDSSELDNVSSMVSSGGTSSNVIANTASSSSMVNTNSSFELSVSELETGSQTASSMATASDRVNAEDYFEERYSEPQSNVRKPILIVFLAVAALGLIALGSFSIREEMAIRKREKKEKSKDE